jgi:ornithine carbamoyltransferase
MGEPEEAWKQRIELLLPYQVTTALMQASGKPRTRFMHCLPAFHNLETEVGRQIHERHGLSELEVTDEVFESDASIVFTQAENRMHIIKAVLVATLA